MVKLIVIYGVPENIEAFENYYVDTHLPLASKIPGVSKVELTRFIGTTTGDKLRQHRMAEVYFDTFAALQEGMRSPEGLATEADIPNFATGGVDILIGEV